MDYEAQQQLAEEEGCRSLVELYPELAAQWHVTKKQPVELGEIGIDYPYPVWWQCGLGHAWKATVADRVNGEGNCPYCLNRKVWAGFNDLETVDPDVAEQWHPSLNGTLTPRKVVADSKKRVWWLCQKGHAWRETVSSRTRKRSGLTCPVCNGSIKDIGGLHL